MSTVPGEEVWVVGGAARPAQENSYLANLPADADLKTLAATIKARWGGREVTSSSSFILHFELTGEIFIADGADGHDRLRLPPACSAAASGGKKNCRPAAALPATNREKPVVPPPSRAPLYRGSDRPPEVRRPLLLKSAKVVLGPRL